MENRLQQQHGTKTRHNLSGQETTTRHGLRFRNRYSSIDVHFNSRVQQWDNHEDNEQDNQLRCPQGFTLTRSHTFGWLRVSIIIRKGRIPPLQNNSTPKRRRSVGRRVLLTKAQHETFLIPSSSSPSSSLLYVSF